MCFAERPGARGLPPCLPPCLSLRVPRARRAPPRHASLGQVGRAPPRYALSSTTASPQKSPARDTLRECLVP